MSQACTSDWLVDRGALGELIRSRDWSNTPLGPREHWPVELRTLLNMVLAYPQPMTLAWGRDWLLFYNESYIKILQDRHPAALGRPMGEVWSEQWELSPPTYTALMDRGENVLIEDESYTIERGTGVEQASFTISCCPVHGPGGVIAGALMAFQDTSGQRRLVRARAESSERYRVLFAESPVPTMLSRRPSGAIINVNAAFLRLFELEAAQVIGRHTAELGLGTTEAIETVRSEIALHGTLHDFECQLKTRSGAPLTVKLDIVPIRAADDDFVISTIRDLTAQRKLEQVSQLYEKSRERLLDLDAMERLQKVSSLFLDARGSNEVLEAILEAAIAITQADFGKIQVVDQETEELVIAVQKGLPDWWIEYWKQVRKERGTCGAALARGERVIVEDVMTSPLFQNEEALGVQLRAGIRAVQSTPLLSRSGVQLGIISTHFRQPGRPSERALRFLDVLARQAADIVERTQTELALRRSEAKARSLLEYSADAIVSIDRNQRIVEWNRGAESMFGYTRSEILGQELGVLLPARSRGTHPEHIAKFLADPPTSRHMGLQSARGMRKNGQVFPISATISNFEFEGERVTSASIRDISEQNRQESEQRLLADVGGALSNFDRADAMQAVLEILTRELADYAGIAFMEADGTARRVAAASQDPEKATIARALTELQPAIAPSHPTYRAVESRKAFTMNVGEDDYARIAQSPEHLKVLHATHPCSLLSAPLMLGEECIGALGLSSSSRNFDDNDLRLMQEVAQRCALFMDNARLHAREKRALSVRDEVLGVVAHDLRNPLNAIILHAQMLRRRGEQPERRSQSPVEAIRRSAQRMNYIVRDLLDVARFESGRLSVEPVRVKTAELLRETLAAEREQVLAHSLELLSQVDDVLPDVWADRQRIFQVFENLITNAVKFTKTGSITVGAKARADEVQLWVSDTGSGIAEEHLPHLFDRFWQADKGAREGAGLGLGIVKSIIDAHDGRLWVDSRIGLGTTVCFTLPTRPRSEPGLEPIGGSATSASGVAAPNLVSRHSSPSSF
jgi:PAS domain S-box-containing protein